VKGVRRGEWPTLILSFLYFLLLLASYYAVRSIRDALVSGLSATELKFLNTTVFFVMLAVAPLFGLLMTHVPRRKLLPAVYAFFTVNLLCFAIAFTIPKAGAWPARVFYVWLTVFNMFVVSVFWSFMADIWREEQGRRLFGLIAAGGSLGGLLGPALTKLFVESLGTSGIVFIAALLLSGTVVCLLALAKLAFGSNTEQTHPARPFQGSSWQGFIVIMRSPFLLGIAALVLIGSLTSQFAYNELLRLARETFATPETRAAFFANLDFWTNVAALILQAIAVGALTVHFGIIAPLIGLTLVGFFSFGALAVSPILTTLAVSTVARRSAEFGLGKPARDMVYTVATPQEKYLAKNVIDTVISRGGDVSGAWIYSGLVALGATLAGFGALSAVAMIGAVFVSLAVARGYHRRGGK
jgi:ATP:ADP antiporter, AAA family